MTDRARATRLLVDWVPPLALAGLAGHELLYNHAPTWQWVTGQGLVWLLVLRRRFPVSVLATCVALVLVAWLRDVVLVAHLGVLVALHAVAWQRPRVYAAVAGLVVEVGGVLVAVRFAPSGSANDGVVLVTGLVLTAVLLGTAQRAQQALVEVLRERADQLEREREQKALFAAAEERNRIAREIHDIVAHTVSVMIALSEGAARTPDEQQARGSMRQVAATGRQALTELRRVLSVLHGPNVGVPDPQPILGDLPTLVGDVERAGLSVDLVVSGDVGTLPEAMQSTMFRIVQESLTNALKHARATRSTVRVEVGGDVVTVEVEDDGTAVAGEAAPSGNGIRGMRERARLYRGTVDAGPGGDGWRVRCTLSRDRASA